MAKRFQFQVCSCLLFPYLFRFCPAFPVFHMHDLLPSMVVFLIPAFRDQRHRLTSAAKSPWGRQSVCSTLSQAGGRVCGTYVLLSDPLSEPRSVLVRTLAMGDQCLNLPGAQAPKQSPQMGPESPIVSPSTCCQALCQVFYFQTLFALLLQSCPFRKPGVST